MSARFQSSLRKEVTADGDGCRSCLFEAKGSALFPLEIFGYFAVAGAKSPTLSYAFVARLKSCPDTKQ
jgi:hypothetical protein